MRPYINYEQFCQKVDEIVTEMTQVLQDSMDEMKEKYKPDKRNYNINVIMYASATISKMILNMFNAIGDLDSSRRMYAAINETVCNSLFEAQVEIHTKENLSGKDMH